MLRDLTPEEANYIYQPDVEEWANYFNQNRCPNPVSSSSAVIFPGLCDKHNARTNVESSFRELPKDVQDTLQLMQNSSNLETVVNRLGDYSANRPEMLYEISNVMFSPLGLTMVSKPYHALIIPMLNFFELQIERVQVGTETSYAGELLNDAAANPGHDYLYLCRLLVVCIRNICLMFQEPDIGVCIQLLRTRLHEIFECREMLPPFKVEWWVKWSWPLLESNLNASFMLRDDRREYFRYWWTLIIAQMFNYKEELEERHMDFQVFSQVLQKAEADLAKNHVDLKGLAQIIRVSMGNPAYESKNSMEDPVATPYNDQTMYDPTATPHIDRSGTPYNDQGMDILDTPFVDRTEDPTATLYNNMYDQNPNDAQPMEIDTEMRSASYLKKKRKPKSSRKRT